MAQSLEVLVEELVESTSQLILGVVNEQYASVKNSALTLASSTNKIALRVQDIALQSNDPDFQTEATDAIHHIATAIGSLVAAFTDLIQNPQQKNKHAFTVASKDVGEAINELIVVTDKATSRKLQERIKRAIEYGHRIVKSLDDRDAITELRNENKEILETSALIIRHAADPIKRKKIFNASHQVQDESIDFLKIVIANYNNGVKTLSTKSFYDTALYVSYENLLNASSGHRLDYIQKIHETVAYIRELLELTENLKLSVLAHKNFVEKLLDKRSELDKPSFVASAKKVANDTIKLLEQTYANINKMDDNVRKMQIVEIGNRLKKKFK